MAQGLLPTVAPSGGGLTRQVPISGVDAVLNVPAAAMLCFLVLMLLVVLLMIRLLLLL